MGGPGSDRNESEAQRRAECIPFMTVVAFWYRRAVRPKYTVLPASYAGEQPALVGEPATHQAKAKSGTQTEYVLVNSVCTTTMPPARVMVVGADH
jgi:hypothetical protein